jgi:mono/diheme cytochrome c family protein
LAHQEQRSTMWRILVAVIVVLILAFVGFFAWSWPAEIPALAEAPAPNSFAPDQIKRGAQLAALGDCTTCHTAPNGRPYAGGVPVPTPFGTVYASNITPDRETGIGAWPEEAFRRALREGVGRDGTHFYPAFPYDHFTQMSDDDIAAVYAYLMTREPVEQANKEPNLTFPLNARLFAAAWQILFLRRGPYQADSAKDGEWNRGAYLADSVGHCGSCHTPRNFLGAEDRRNRFGGGVAENWVGPALNDSSPAPIPWTAEQLFAYLRDGIAEQHGTAAGPMQPVVANMRKLPEADVRAIAAYVASLAGPQDAAARERQTKDALEFAQQRELKVAAGPAANATTGSGGSNDNANSDGAAIFAGACATCHREGGELPASRPIPLGLSSTVNDPSPINFAQIVVNGIHPQAGTRGRFMPGFAGALTDRQIAALASYVRGHFSRQPAWQDVDRAVSNANSQQASAGSAQ